MEKRKIYIGADSAGYPLKEHLKEYLRARGYEVEDMGTDSTASCHYPVYARAVAREVQKRPDEVFGILVCGTGIGMSMCANKYKGVRAAVCSEEYSARLTRNHNNANVLCIGARVTGECLAESVLDAFLTAEFEGGRHQTRLDMMREIEEEN
ncbi:MAG: ribose 5-phosphate isomerase B [Eubacteriales bacterium]